MKGWNCVNMKEIDDKIISIEEKIKRENDNTVFSITKIKNLTFRETSFIHIDGNFKIILQFTNKKNYVRIWLLKHNRKMGYKATKKIELDLDQENAIYKAINLYKKEISLRNIF
jgi:hypothetical protein